MRAASCPSTASGSSCGGSATPPRLASSTQRSSNTDRAAAGSAQGSTAARSWLAGRRKRIRQPAISAPGAAVADAGLPGGAQLRRGQRDLDHPAARRAVVQAFQLLAEDLLAQR